MYTGTEQEWSKSPIRSQFKNSADGGQTDEETKTAGVGPSCPGTALATYFFPFLFFFLLSHLIFGNFNFWYLIISVSEEAARAPEARSEGQIKIPTGEEWTKEERVGG